MARLHLNQVDSAEAEAGDLAADLAAVPGGVQAASLAGEEQVERVVQALVVVV